MVKQKQEHINRIFRALADPTRRQILEMVSKEDLQASDLAHSFKMSFPAVSKHLKVLEKAQLINREVNGRIHRFRFKGSTMKKAYQWIKFYEKFWMQNLNNLDDYFKNTKKKEKLYGTRNSHT